MRVRMRVSISGTRGGVDWPPAGALLECARDEAAHLVRAGLAEPEPEPEPEPDPVETATVDTPVETAVPKRTRKPRTPRKSAGDG